MTDPREGEMTVNLTVDDVRTAQLAGAKFAHTLAGATTDAFMLALTERERLVEHAITDAGHSAEQARLAAGHFAAVARDEWERIAA